MLRVWGFRFRAQEDQGSGFGVWVLRVQGLRLQGFRVQGYLYPETLQNASIIPTQNEVWNLKIYVAQPNLPVVNGIAPSAPPDTLKLESGNLVNPKVRWKGFGVNGFGSRHAWVTGGWPHEKEQRKTVALLPLSI